jgi:[NiFe] hydrogenase assembly HybE family chaperone
MDETAACDPRAERRAQRLAAYFADVAETRMAGIPILNLRLRVAVIGMQRWQHEWLCVVLTPWFMSLVLLPADDDAIGPPASNGSDAVGGKATVRLPAGRFEFIWSHDPAIGFYRTCSLFSPVFEFDDQETAVAAAEAALAAVLDPGAEERDAEDDGMVRIWRGERVPREKADAAAVPDATSDAAQPAADRTATAATSASDEPPEIGRRRFLLGPSAAKSGDRA